MSGYSVHRLKASGQRVVRLQYPRLDTGATVLVAPLYPAEKALELKIVTPRVEVDGSEFLVATHLLAAVQQKDIGPPEATLAAYEYVIANAINRLFFGI